MPDWLRDRQTRKPTLHPPRENDGTTTQYQHTPALQADTFLGTDTCHVSAPFHKNQAKSHNGRSSRRSETRRSENKLPAAQDKGATSVQLPSLSSEPRVLHTPGTQSRQKSGRAVRSTRRRGRDEPVVRTVWLSHMKGRDAEVMKVCAGQVENQGQGRDRVKMRTSPNGHSDKNNNNYHCRMLQQSR